MGPFLSVHLLIFIFLAVVVLITQSCPTLSTPKDRSPLGSPVHGILQARILEWVAIPFSRGIFPTQGSNPGLLYCRQILYSPSYQERNNKFISHFYNISILSL